MQEINHETCPLCNHSSRFFFRSKKRHYFRCQNCSGIFMAGNLLPDKTDEKKRYEEHNNDVENPGYQNFVRPLVNSILNDFTATSAGLDFGSGTGPVVAKLLRDQGFSVKLYDPFFHDRPKVLQEKYDYIACCEVMEHFHRPAKEFKLLKKLLLTNGKLYCMTDLYDESIDFKTWYYKDDLTHVFIYHRRTIDWIKNNFNFSGVKIEGRLIVFSN